MLNTKNHIYSLRLPPQTCLKEEIENHSHNYIDCLYSGFVLLAKFQRYLKGIHILSISG